MKRQLNLALGLTLTVFLVLGIGQTAFERMALAQARAASQAPRVSPPTFQVDPFWPKPLPNHWILGSVTGVAVDARDHVWLVHRGMDSLTARTEAGLATNPPTAESCCAPAPYV